jgi:hypothetical protein
MIKKKLEILIATPGQRIIVDMNKLDLFRNKKFTERNEAETYKKFNQKRKMKIWNSYFIMKKSCNILKFKEKVIGKRVMSEMKIMLQILTHASKGKRKSNPSLIFIGVQF